MIEYKTLVIVDSEIYDRVELYKSFLKKSEFGIRLDEVCFIDKNSADSILSAEWNSLHSCMFLYGQINGEKDYSEKYDEIEKLRMENPNPNYYMFFCQKKYTACAPYMDAGGNVKKTFSVGVITEDEERGEELSILKLISMVIAFCDYNSGASKLSFGNYYETATVELNITNVYYAVLHVISSYADAINLKTKLIKEKKDLIEELKLRKPKKCMGVFDKEPEKELEKLTVSLAEDKDLKKNRHNMEFAYNKGVELLKTSASKKIEVARNALAIADRCVERLAICDAATAKRIESEMDNQPYMTVFEVEEKDATLPDELLDRVDDKVSFDFFKFRSLFPYANKLSNGEGSGVGRVIGFSLLAVLAFALCICSVYAVRYFILSLQSYLLDELLLVVGGPALLIIFAGVIGTIVALIAKFLVKRKLAKLYELLYDFLRTSQSWCKNIEEYINKYLSVYYNYHVKYARISTLEEDIKRLESDIRKLSEEAEPYERTATLICSLTDENIQDKAVETLEESSEGSAFATIEAIINRSKETNVLGLPEGISSPWITRISCEIGNINGGEQ